MQISMNIVNGLKCNN